MTSSFYKTVYQRKFNELPRWKRLAIVEDSENNKWSGLLTDFIKSVIEEAEKEYANSITKPTVNESKYSQSEESSSKKIVGKKS